MFWMKTFFFCRGFVYDDDNFTISTTTSGVPDPPPGAGGLLRLRCDQPLHHARGRSFLCLGLPCLQVPGTFDSNDPAITRR